MRYVAVSYLTVLIQFSNHHTTHIFQLGRFGFTSLISSKVVFCTEYTQVYIDAKGSLQRNSGTTISERQSLE